MQEDCRQNTQDACEVLMKDKIKDIMYDFKVKTKSKMAEIRETVV